MPDYAHEAAFAAELGCARVAGIDEVGRGPWAGPVTAAAVVLDMTRLPDALARRLTDSKLLARAAREALEAEMLGLAGHALWFGLGQASVDEIDRLNILRASLLAMERAAAALPVAAEAALVDGNRTPGNLPCPARAVVGGDGLCLSIAAASILAKVARDRAMRALAADHPGYGWETNAGYGTRAHQAALARLGVTPHHRRSFAPVARLIGSNAAGLSLAGEGQGGGDHQRSN